MLQKEGFYAGKSFVIPAFQFDSGRIHLRHAHVSLRHPGPEGGLILDGGSLGLNQRSLS